MSYHHRTVVILMQKLLQVMKLGEMQNQSGRMTSICEFVPFLGGVMVRAVGVDYHYADDIAELDRRLSEWSQRIFYKRLDALPKILSKEASDDYLQRYRDFQARGQTAVYTRASGQANGALFFAEGLKSLQAFCHQRMPSMSESMIDNLCVQCLFRLDAVFEGGVNVMLAKKIVLPDITGKNEYLFAYMLTLMGCDVMLLQYRADISEPLERLGLSTKFTLGGFTSVYPVASAQPSRSVHTLPMPSPPQRTEVPRPVRTTPVVSLPPDAPVVTVPKRPDRRSAAARSHPSLPPDAPVVSVPRHPHRRTYPPPAPSVPYGGSSVPPQRTEKSYEELARLASSVVMIECHNSWGKVISAGSGIMIGREGYILTNYHVVNEGTYFSIKIENDETVYRTNRVIKYHPVTDLAVIRINRPLQPLPVYRGRQRPVRGQRVVAIGSPLGLFNSVSDGIIAGMRRVGDIEMIQFTAPVSHGSSGGAVLNLYGEVIGITTAGIQEGQNINLAVGYEYIHPLAAGFV